MRSNRGTVINNNLSNSLEATKPADLQDSKFTLPASVPSINAANAMTCLVF